MTDRTWSLLKDPSTWRDIAWLFMDVMVSPSLSVLVLAFLLSGPIPLSAALLGDAAVESWKGGEVFVGTFSITIQSRDDLILAAIVGLLVTPIIVKKFGEMYRVNLGGYVIATLGRLGVLVAAYFHNIPLMLILSGVGIVTVTVDHAGAFQYPSAP